VSDALRVANTTVGSGNANQAWTTVVGKAYKVGFSALASSGANLDVRIGTSLSSSVNYRNSATSAGVDYTAYFVATATTTVLTIVAFNSSGAIGSSVAIDNISVKEYLGITATGATPKGLLIEEQRTNLVTYSEQFDNAAWGKTNVTVTANTVVSPDGTVNADKLIATTTNALHIIEAAAASFTAGSLYTASVYAKKGETSFLQITFSSAAIPRKVNFDLNAGVTGTVDAGMTASIINVGNGWYRCIATGTSDATGSYRTVFGLITSATAARFEAFAGDGTSGVYLWGAQLEAGAFATSYIPTVASQVTRAADSASMIGNNFARWYNQSAGTVFAQYSVNGLNPASSNAAYGISAGSTSDFITGRTAANQLTNFAVRVSGVDQVFLTSTTVAVGAVAKSAGAYALNDFSFTANAGTVQTDTSGTLPFVTQMQIGGLTSSVNPLNGHLARLAFYSRKLAPTEQQGITS
jgi:hypothetical protein